MMALWQRTAQPSDMRPNPVHITPQWLRQEDPNTVSEGLVDRSTTKWQSWQGGLTDEYFPLFLHVLQCNIEERRCVLVKVR